MDISNVLSELKAERYNIDRAIAALEGLSSPKSRGGRLSAGGTRRRMSAAARARIGAAKKAWWAKQKSKSARKTVAPKRKPMSPAMRRKLSAMMKARWAEQHKATAA